MSCRLGASPLPPACGHLSGDTAWENGSECTPTETGALPVCRATCPAGRRRRQHRQQLQQGPVAARRCAASAAAAAWRGGPLSGWAGAALRADGALTRVGPLPRTSQAQESRRSSQLRSERRAGRERREVEGYASGGERAVWRAAGRASVHRSICSTGGGISRVPALLGRSCSTGAALKARP